MLALFYPPVVSDHALGSITRKVSRRLRNWKTWILVSFSLNKYPDPNVNPND